MNNFLKVVLDVSDIPDEFGGRYYVDYVMITNTRPRYEIHSTNFDNRKDAIDFIRELKNTIK